MSRGNTYSVPRDANRVPALLGVSSVDGTTVLPAEINPATGALITETTVVVNNPTDVDNFNNVLVDDTGTILFAAKADRVGATIFNEGPDVVFIKLGSGASPTSYNVRMVLNSYYELPYTWVGEISAICDVGGTAQVRAGELS